MSEILKKSLEILASIGGIGIIIIGISSFISNLLAKKIEQKHKYKYDRELEELKFQLQAMKDRDIEILRYDLGKSKEKGSLFNTKQFEMYSKIWDSLFQLKLKGDLLWEEVSSTRLEQFAEQLKKTKEEIGQFSLFIQEDDYEELSKILLNFSNFSDGKVRLWEIRNLREVDNWQAERMIENNLVHKNRYSDLLEKIKRDIRNRINGDEELLFRDYYLREEQRRREIEMVLNLDKK